MSADLDELQSRLKSHFAALCEARRSDGLPVFALEHGLNAAAILSLSTMLKARLKVQGATLDRHWLLWVVWATEQGYDYDGDEYWHTFERRMPLWDRSWRPELRSWFMKFQKTYAGLKPTGPWAKFFSIIAWPITHSLLPKDLQSQLAQTLYFLRFNLVSRLGLPPAEIARFVMSMSYDGSSRLRNFLEQEESAGRIILALLDDRVEGEGSSISLDTLDRIVGDLEKARNARQWLRDTRKVVEVARLKGAARPAVDGATAGATHGPITAERQPVLRPSMMLRRTAVDAWTVMMELPSFREIADVAPELAEFIRRTRCKVAGSTGWLPAGWLLTGTQRRTLSQWPSPEQPVLSFEKPNAAMDHLLLSEGRISPGPNWLFRVGSDGQAIEILSRLIRPGSYYLLISVGEPRSLSSGRATSVACAGVHALRLEIPASLSAELIAELKGAGLSVAQTIRIWPSGLAARGWDGEGATEWIEGECPCFAIEHDHPIDSYELRLGGGTPITISALAPGAATFVRLKPLGPGNHVLSVKARRGASDAETGQHQLEGVVTLFVRPPSPWVSGTLGHSGLFVGSEPPEPTLDEFWEGLTRLDVLGPTGARVTVCVELLDGTGNLIVREEVGQLILPLGPDTWRRAFAAFAGRDKHPWAYLQASSGRIVVDGEELGASHIHLYRVVAPVRWVWHSTPKTVLLKLVDDHDAGALLDVMFHAFAAPVGGEPLTPELATAGFEPAAPGGLFVAKYGEHREALIVSMPKVDGGFGGLLIKPSLGEVSASPDGLISLIRAVAAWSDVRLVGSLAAQRRDHVVACLKERLFAVLCGRRWAEAERRYIQGVGGQANTDLMVDYFGPGRTFGTVLVRDALKYSLLPDHVRLREFSSLAERYHVPGHIHSKAALDFCDIVERGTRLGEAELKELLARVCDAPILAAGARLLYLVAVRTRPVPVAGAA
jgi:hypothetical protein